MKSIKPVSFAEIDKDYFSNPKNVEKIANPKRIQKISNQVCDKLHIPRRKMEF